MTTMAPHRDGHRPGALAVALGLGGLALVTLAGCGDDSDGTASPDGVEDADLRVQARDIDFDRDRYEVPAGTSTIDYVQDGALEHTLLIQGPGGDVDGFELAVNGQQGDTGSVDLQPGTYTLYCDVAGHREAGMEAELVVQPRPAPTGPRR
jgi:plastocyanin